jgi:uncharacterized Zn finger protein
LKTNAYFDGAARPFSTALRENCAAGLAHYYGAIVRAGVIAKASPGPLVISDHKHMSAIVDFGRVLSDLVKQKDIYSFFSRSAFDKGQRYQVQGRVTGLEISDDLTRLRAKVRGEPSTPYRVEIELEFSHGRLADIDGTCSCPMAVNCKHVAATMLEALSGKQSAAGAAPPEQLALAVSTPVLALRCGRLARHVQHGGEARR